MLRNSMRNTEKNRSGIYLRVNSQRTFAFEIALVVENVFLLVGFEILASNFFFWKKGALTEKKV